MPQTALTDEASIAVELHEGRGVLRFANTTLPQEVERWLISGGAQTLEGLETLEVSFEPEHAGGPLPGLLALASPLKRHLPDTAIRVSAPLDQAGTWMAAAGMESTGTRQDGGDERRTLLTSRTLRSGTQVRFDGDVTVFGDVHSGAEIVASGNVMVMGKLAGMAHAGADGDEHCFVFALHMAPTQIRVASRIAVVPHGNAREPAIAQLQDQRVVVQPFGPRVLGAPCSP
jgi:hypothetical protein